MSSNFSKTSITSRESSFDIRVPHEEDLYIPPSSNHQRDSDEETVLDDIIGIPDPLSAILPGSFLRRPRQLIWSLFQRLLFKSRVAVIIVLIMQSLEHVFARVFGGKPEVVPVSPSDGNHHFKPPPHRHTRSPCPALNMLANHGYLPRDGRNIRRGMMIRALQEGFRLSYPLAWVVTYGGYLLTGQFKMMSLYDLRRHNGVEHDASLIHADTWHGYEYAPAHYDGELWAALENDSEDGATLTVDDFARARLRREAESGELDPTHAEIARGEVALVVDIFGTSHRRIDLKMLRQMFCDEQFPPHWKPTHEQTLARSILTAQGIKQRMIAKKTGEPLHQNWIQKLVKIYMILCEPPSNDGPCHMHGCPVGWRRSD